MVREPSLICDYSLQLPTIKYNPIKAETMGLMLYTKIVLSDPFQKDWSHERWAMILSCPMFRAGRCLLIRHGEIDDG